VLIDCTQKVTQNKTWSMSLSLESATISPEVTGEVYLFSELRRQPQRNMRIPGLGF